MTTKLQKRGNALWVKIPKGLAKKAKLKEDSKIIMEYQNQKIIIFPKKEKPPTLKDLLSKITKNNLHSEEKDDYAPVGKELL